MYKPRRKPMKRNNRHIITMYLAGKPAETFTATEIGASLSIPVPATWTALQTLVRDELVIASADGRYAVNAETVRVVHP